MLYFAYMDIDAYTQTLVEILISRDKWPELSFTDEFDRLSLDVVEEIGTGTVSAKMASIFINHQIVHEMLKNLIAKCNLYIQGEIWPVVYRPKFDSGDEKMTGWYISYFNDSCIDLKAKADFIKYTSELNRLRNKVAHNLTGKNNSIISETHRQFMATFSKAVVAYAECESEVLRYLTDLTNRVDFSDFIDQP